MSHRSYPNLKILLITLGLWTTSSSSYLSVPGNGTTTLTSSFGHTGAASGNAQNFGEAVRTEVSTSYNATASSQLSLSQSGCSYVLGYATFWPGPSVITRTDSTICPSLASMASALIVYTQHA
jgi:hypothetical protein